jgi:signal transduction histidine kinase
MSIRLRFTLVYSAILAVTLAVFGVALFSIQSQTTLEALKKALIQSSETLGSSVLQSAVPVNINGETQPPPNSVPPPPKPFDDFSPGQGFQDIPEREIVRILDKNGNLLASPYGRSEDVLPLSHEGLQVLQAQKEWWQTDIVQGQRMLIYNRPIQSEGQVSYIIQVARPLTERDNSLQSLATTLVLASLVTLLLAFGVGWRFSGFVLQPIQRITQTASAIGEKSDFSQRVAYKGPPDEVGQLATTFNNMLARLQDSFQRVAHALEMQRSFVADVSHELRTPLTTLRGNLELLRRRPAIPAEEQADIINDMVDESDRLIRLVNDLLVLARADAGRHLACEPVLVLPALQEVCRQAQVTAPERQILLNASDGLRFLGDRDAYKQVVLILIDNALKYSEGDVWVTVEQHRGVVETRVRDQGKGIPPEKLEHLFDRFYRAAEDAGAPGFGLGLSIAKSLVEGQNGKISVTSQVGKGSELLLQFPAAG